VGRNNADFHESVLYHASPHPFQPGDIVLPRRKLYPGAADHDRPAFATDSPLVASTYEGKVYQVEPVDPDEVEKSRPFFNVGPDKHTAHYYTSQKGFKVMGQA
jgi:hypothetical protein